MLFLVVCLKRILSRFVFGQVSVLIGIPRSSSSPAPIPGHMRQKENPENSLSCHSLGSKVSSQPVFFSPLLESYICLCPGLLAGLCRRRRDKYIYSILPRNQKSMICLFLNFIYVESYSMYSLESGFFHPIFCL